MTRSAQRLLGTLLIALLAISLGCATGRGSSAPENTTADDVAELKARVVELQRQAVMGELEMDRLRQQVRALEALIAGGATAGAARRPADPTSSNPRPLEEPRLEDRIAARSDSGGEVEEENLADEDLPVVDIPSRDADPRPPLPAAAAPSNLEPPTVGATTTTPSASAQDLYDEGYAQYHQGNYIDAESRFRRFLQESGNTNLADNAQYWIGEARFARGDTRGALAAFRETVERYPQGNKVPDALLKAGQCLELLGDSDGARASYREIVRRFPSSAASAVAEERIAKLP